MRRCLGDWRAHSCDDFRVTDARRLIIVSEGDFNAFIPPGERFDLDGVPAGCCIRADCTSRMLLRQVLLLPGLAWPGSAASDPWRYLDLAAEFFFLIFFFIIATAAQSEGRSVPLGRTENILISPFTFSLRTPSSHGYLMDTVSGPSAPSPHSILHPDSLPPAHSRQPPPAWGILFEHLRR